jgi:hypothetical protein
MMLGWKCDDDDGIKEMVLMFLLLCEERGNFAFQCQVLLHSFTEARGML